MWAATKSNLRKTVAWMRGLIDKYAYWLQERRYSGSLPVYCDVAEVKLQSAAKLY